MSTLGPRLTAEGVELAVWSQHATAMTLQLFGPGGEPGRAIALDPGSDRAGDIWRTFVPGAGPGLEYAWRADGPAGPRHAFDPALTLLDPYAPLVAGGEEWGRREPGGRRYRSVVADLAFDWGDDRPPGTALADTVIHETHVRAFTRHPSSGVRHPGTYAGIIEKLPELVDLGVTALQLLPIAEFDETENPRSNPLTGERLLNVWGYDPIAFLAPKVGYSAAGTPQGALDEFRALVRAAHAHGIEIILDVVFNHTGEGSRHQVPRSWRGLDRAHYYLTDGSGRDLDFTGCGHTVACQSPPMMDLIVEALAHWAQVCRVDGFRFDIASVLTRGLNGAEMADPPLIRRIAEDPRLAHCKLIAEAWDAAGLYQVGRFPHHGRWAELNGRFRDDIRRFLKGTGHVGALATRLAGSSDLYAQGRTPGHSVNYLTSHDGFTLHDLVSYERKHNEANGEGNRDGSNENDNWNHGAEGPSNDPHVTALRARQKRNFATTLLLGQGAVLWLWGDDRSRTQFGNNNAWCQDSPGFWLDWALHGETADFHRFVRGLLHLRRSHRAFRRREFFDPRRAGPGQVLWHGERAMHMDWSESSRRLGMHLLPTEGEPDFLLYVNGAGDRFEFELPPPTGNRRWHRVLDTSLPAPEDWREPADAAPLGNAVRYEAGPLSTVLLLAR